MLNCNNNDQTLFEREVSNNSIKLNCVTESNPILCHFFESELYLASGNTFLLRWSIQSRVSPIHDPSNPIYSHFFKVSYTCFEQYILADQSGPESSPIYSHFFESELSHLSYVSPLFFWRTMGPSPMCEAYCGGYAKGAAMKLVVLSSARMLKHFERSWMQLHS